jgi:hypothetical protein
METGDGVGSGMRNLCRYGAEKSDSLVVLMKESNNCRLWWAEALEERADFWRTRGKKPGPKRRTGTKTKYLAKKE